MRGFLDQITKKVSDLKETGVTLKLSKEMILQILQTQIKEESLSISSVEFKDELLIINGVKKQMMVRVKFSIVLIPVGGEKRVLHFKVKRVKPIHNEWLINKILNDKSPHLSYSDHILSMDLAQVEKVKSIPVGNFKNAEIRDGRLLVKIGL